MHSFLIKLETPFSGPISGPFWVIKPQNKIFMMTFYDNFMQKNQKRSEHQFFVKLEKPHFEPILHSFGPKNPD